MFRIFAAKNLYSFFIKTKPPVKLHYLFIPLFFVFYGAKINFSPNSTSENEIFEPYHADAYILEGNVDIFDIKLQKIGVLNLKPFEKVHISAKSTRYYPLKAVKMCDQYFLLKIRYKGKMYIASGKNIYASRSDTALFEDAEKNKCEVLYLHNFDMRSFCNTGECDEEGGGLTGCYDFTNIAIHRIKDNRFSFIQFPTKYGLAYFALEGSEMQSEEIYKIKQVSDSIFLSVKAHYQEGFGAYELHFMYDARLSKGIITNNFRFDTQEAQDEFLKK
jgi:hypothetical protein